MFRSVFFLLLVQCVPILVRAQLSDPAAVALGRDIAQASTAAGRKARADQPTQPAVFEPADADRLHRLIDAQGSIQLSVADAILLVLENNLDIASARLLEPIAQSDLLRAKAGELLRNVPITVSSGPTSASGSLASATSSGFEGLSSGQSGLLSGLSIQLAGSRIPNTEPVLYASGSYSHNNLPEMNPVVAGTNLLTSKTGLWQAGLQKSFMTGTTVDAHITSLRLSQNSPNNSINPAFTADAEIKLLQPLLQGFSRKVNMRAIHIASNDRKISAMTFHQQVSATVTQALTLYYDLVSFRDQLEVSKKALEQSQAYVAENRKRLDLGLINASDYVDAEEAVYENEQATSDAETQILQQEATLKTVLTKKGLADPVVLAARIVPTDRFHLPSDPKTDEALDQVQERAIGQRLEVAQAEIDMQNKQLSLLGTREALKPTLNVYVALQSNALAGRINPLGSQQFTQGVPAIFDGGYGKALSQIAKGSYGDYEFGFELNVPLTNQAAEADLSRDLSDLKQQQIAREQLLNGIRLQSLKSALALRQARRQYKASLAERKLREDSLSTEQKMFDVGTSSVSRLLVSQRELELSQLREITAYNTYVRAVVNLDSVMDETLTKNHVILDDWSFAEKPQQQPAAGKQPDPMQRP